MADHDGSDMADLVTAELEVVDEGDEEQQDAIPMKGEAGERAKESQQLDSVADNTVDATAQEQINEQQSAALLVSLREREAAEQAQREQREKELAAVTVSPQDISFLETEFDMETKKAELILRRNTGNLVAAINNLLETFPSPIEVGVASKS